MPKLCMIFNEDDPTDLTQAIGAVRSMGGEGGTHPLLSDCQNWAKMTEEHFVPAVSCGVSRNQVT